MNINKKDEFVTIIDCIQLWKESMPNKKAYTFLTDGESIEESLTYKELNEKSLKIAASLQKICKKGDRALLLFSSGLDFIVSFYGCLYAGVIAIPAYPPKKNRKMERLNLIIEDCNAKVILSGGKTFDNVVSSFKKHKIEEEFNWLNVDEILTGNDFNQYKEVNLKSDDISFLQYTSGSTGEPKGVIVTHGNLISNSELIYNAMDHSSETVVVSWLPLFHDMGLIGGMIQSLYSGGSSIILSPENFLLKPIRWFKAISKYRATSTGAPNFAFDHCCNVIKDQDLSEIDLSSLKVVFSGAEPILSNTLKRFSHKFVASGFTSNMFYPCYGMAESTLMISGPNVLSGYNEVCCNKNSIHNNKLELCTQEDSSSKTLVGCGHVWNDHNVVIVNPENKTLCKDHEIGEIWVNGSSIAKGYWNKPELTDETFNAFINDSNSGPFLRTGDLGVVKDNELYITGRLKDLIIIRGRNLYPQDIEISTFNSNVALSKYSSAAFSIEDNGDEKLVIVQEIKRSYVKKIDCEDIINDIRSNIYDDHGMNVHSIVLIKPYSIPKTSSGKIQRRKCKELYLNEKLDVLYFWSNNINHSDNNVVENKEIRKIYDRTEIQSWLLEKISRITNSRLSDIDKDKPMSSYGIDSLSGVSLIGECQDYLQTDIPVTAVYDYPTINDMVDFLYNQVNEISTSQNFNQIEKGDINEPIAIIGMECFFPGANNYNEFWKVLNEEIDSVTEIPLDRWDWRTYYSKDNDIGKMNTKWGGFIKDIDMFDASFFNIAPVEARDMDPQQRILLEQIYKTLENSGYSMKSLKGSNTGVFIGISNNDYGSALKQSKLTPYFGTGNSSSIAANRVSYTFDWKGPSLAVDTACSSSLSAIHLACQSIRNGECEMAFAGAANIILTPEITVALSQTQMMSPDGRCKTFDNNANGYVRSEGCGVVALKKLSKAVNDNDNILAVIDGSAMVQDGKSNGLTSPNGRSQQEVISKALINSNKKPEDICYVEAHGTGTSLGDPIEINALNKVYGENRKENLLVGSAKANVGHLEVCAGMAGVIKTVLCLKHGLVPPQLHIEQLNSHIDWDNVNIDIPFKHTELKQKKGKKLSAGVSSFGFGGTNCHIVLSQGEKEVKYDKKAPEYIILPISGNSIESLNDTKKSYLDFLSDNSCIYSVSATASIHRDHYKYKDFFVGNNINDVKKQIGDSITSNYRKKVKIEEGSIAFVFSGQGSQYPGMGQELYGKYHSFTNTLDKCAEILRNKLSIELFDILWGKNTDLLNLTEYSQLAIFSLEAALGKMWLSFGVKPSVFVGHSLGEYAAAYIAEVFSLEDALSLVSTRAKLMSERTDEGAMLYVNSNIETVQKYIRGAEGHINIAAINGSRNVVLAGEVKSISHISTIFERDDIYCKKLDISVACHSSLMLPVLDSFRHFAEKINYNTPKVKIISNLTGDVQEKFTADYWVTHILETVRFTASMDKLKEMNIKSFLEIGPSSTLLGLLAGYIENSELLLPSLNHKLSSQRTLLESIGDLYCGGTDIIWNNVYSDEYVKTKLPGYVFNKKRFWNIDNNQINSDKRVVKNKDLEQVQYKMNNIENEIKTIINTISGISTNEIDFDTNLISLGLDSLMLVQFRKKISENYSLDINIEKFLIELTSVRKIADYIKDNLSTVNSNTTLDYEVHENNVNTETNDLYENEDILTLLESKKSIIKNISQSLNKLDFQIEKVKKNISYNKIIKHEKVNFRGYKFDDDKLTEQQTHFIAEIITSYTEKTLKSKSYNTKLKESCSHWLSSLNFRKTLKEILYPLVIEKSNGATIWDIDGNEYIDLAMGYGVHFFGHNTEFINNAIKSQVDKGFVLSPFMDNIEEASTLLKKITGVDRLTFCNTGSEAVMFAIRLARTYTGKKKVIKFAGSYHGVYDGILAEKSDDNLVPLCPGISDGSFEDLEVLLYGSSESLNRIKEIKDDIAAVLVEPVQSRRPGLQPLQFLKELREIINGTDSVLILDEMITGFRIAPGGVQSYWGIEADLVTYGKILGGGMPIGVVAGKKDIMSSVDGGSWKFGDESLPDTETTFIAGTFANHPLTIASLIATLKEIDRNGDTIYSRINSIMEEFADSLNDYFKQNFVPIKINYFGSMFRFESFGEYDLAFNPVEMDLFFYLLKEKGIYIWERKICFLSTAHTYTHIESIKEAVKETIEQIRAGGFTFTTKKTETELVIPMTSAQRRLYSLSLYENGDYPYHITDVKRIKGKLDVDLLKKALNTIVRRHESLRTSFVVENNEFYQKIYDNYDLEIIEKSIDNSDINTAVSEFIKPFDLSKASLMRVLIGEINESEFLLVLDFHHIVVDGYSLTVLAKELMLLYEGFELDRVNKQYRDYLSWETEFVKTEEYNKQKEYWLSKFNDSTEVLNLPTDFKRTSVKDFAGQSQIFTINKDTAKKIKHLSSDLGITNYNFFLSAFYILLYKLTGQVNISLGSPVALREQGNFENAVGMMTNTIVMKSILNTDKEFVDFSNDIKIDSLKSLANKEFLFEDLVRNIKLTNERNPLFDVMFSYENGSDRVLKLKDIEIYDENFSLNISMFDLRLEVIAEKEIFNILIEYDTSLFKSETISRWLDYYLTIINSVIDSSRIKISDINIISKDEKNLLLNTFNNTAYDYPYDKTIVSLFEKQVGETPDNVAVIYEDIKLTYRELNEKANILANYLIDSFDIIADDLIGVMLNRSEKMIISILGILKAGAAYVPIDPDYPEDRKKYIFNDSQIQIVLSDNTDGVYINIDDIFESNNCIENPGKSISSNDLAYVIYTSGSTGNPKGTLIEHGSLINRIHWMQMEYPIDESDTILQKTTYTFDVSVWELFWWSFYGAKVCFLAPGEEKNPKAIIDTIKNNNITTIHFVPSMYTYFLQYVNDNQLISEVHSLKQIFCSGEELTLNHVKSSRNIIENNNTKLVNLYGPTEASIDVTYYNCNLSDTNIPIGKPIYNTKLYIVDSSLNLTPIGVSGELCIAGIGLARGYLKNPELTSAKFIDNPFSPGEKMYRTGDLAKWLPDGNIEFLGRIDNQVKVRGFRIELGEIETSLTKHHAIDSAAVIVSGDSEKIIVAYYTSNNELELSKLRSFLGKMIPDYMIPSFFVHINDIPFTSSGKLNRKALPAFEKNFTSGVDYVAPENDIEDKLVEIWQEILGVNRVGIFDDFFELGGHSLNGTMLITRIKTDFDLSLSFEHIYRMKTIKELSTFIHNLKVDSIDSYVGSDEYEVLEI